MIRIAGLLLALLLVSGSAKGAPSCGTVTQDLLPCLPYLKDVDKNPSSNCCKGIQDLKNQAKGKPDLVAICNCIKSELGKAGKIDLGRAAGLPGKCGVPINLPPISPNMNCSQIHD